MPLKSQRWTTAGSISFDTPDGVSAGWLTMMGGGAGGFYGFVSGAETFPGGPGGGSGEAVYNMLVALSGTISGTVGAGGDGAGFSGNQGGDTSFGPYTVSGAPVVDFTGAVGFQNGGGPTGGSGSSTVPAIGRKAEPLYFGGSAGGKSGTAISGPAGAGYG